MDQQPLPKLDSMYRKAFVTKCGRSEQDQRDSVRIVPPSAVPERMIKQWFPMGTWLMDLVKFGPLWYVFFVEANSRFLIVIVGNAQMLGRAEARGDSSIVGLTYTTEPRIASKTFAHVFREFLLKNRKSKFLNSAGLSTTVDARPVRYIIGDSEKAFWTPPMLDLYRQRGIKWTAVNVKQNGHRQLAILDRVVRTIRDMNYRIYYDEETNTSEAVDEIPPMEMERLVRVYNHTYHSTLSEACGGKITPNDVHFNEALERRIIARAREENYLRQQQSGMLLDVGQKVLVKNDRTEIGEKKRSPYIDGVWTVTKRSGSIYTLKNGDHELIKPRSLLVVRR